MQNDVLFHQLPESLDYQTLPPSGYDSSLQ